MKVRTCFHGKYISVYTSAFSWQRENPVASGFAGMASSTVSNFAVGWKLRLPIWIESGLSGNIFCRRALWATGGASTSKFQKWMHMISKLCSWPISVVHTDNFCLTFDKCWWESMRQINASTTTSLGIFLSLGPPRCLGWVVQRWTVDGKELNTIP